MAKLPILRENLDFLRMDLSRHYIQIDCDFTCYLVLNPSGDVPLEGTDVCVFRIGAWQVDAWVLLTDKFTKNTPGFSACLCWDKTLVTELAHAPQVAESDIDTANSVSSLKGQPVNITGFSLADGDSLPVKSNDDTWVNVKSFADWKSDNPTPVAVQHFIKRYLVGDVLNIDKVRLYCDVQEIEGGYRVIPPNFCCSLPTTFVANTVRSIAVYGGMCGICYTGATSTYTNLGAVADYYIDFTLADDVITNIAVHCRNLARIYKDDGTFFTGYVMNDLPSAETLIMYF